MKSSLTIRNVVFDLGGVLLEWNPAKIVARAFDNPAEGQAVMREIFLHPDWLKFDSGQLTELQAIRLFARKTNRNEDQIRDLMAIYRDSLAPIPESVDFFYELKNSGLRLFCASNIHQSVFRDLAKRHTFLNDFDGVVTSGRIGILKPSPEFYEHLLAAHALNPAETAFVDDRADNVDGALRAGLHGIIFVNVTDCRHKLAVLIGEE